MMADINLQELEPRIADSLLKAELTNCYKLLELSDCEFLKLGNISLKDVRAIRKLVANTVVKAPFTRVSSLLVSPPKMWDKLSTGCGNINTLLRGGIARRGITELSGESATGKTQMCLQLTIMVQLPTVSGGYDSGAVYICTEDKFPSVRLQQLFTSFPLCKKEDPKKLGDNIFTEHIADVDSLKQCVQSRLPMLLNQQSIGLIIVDSITSVFRGDYGPHDLIARAKDLRIIGLQLHSLSKQFNVSVLCVNQVSSVIKSDNSGPSVLIPALGLAWSNLVTTRLQMFRSENNRRLQVIFAPDLPKASCSYTITESGIAADAPTFY